MIDGFVRRYNGAGDIDWTQQFGDILHESASRVSVDASGVYAVGSTTSGSDGFVRKVNAADGAELWEMRLDSLRPGQANVEAIAGGGSVYGAGTVFGFLSGETLVGGWTRSCGITMPQIILPGRASMELKLLTQLPD